MASNSLYGTASVDILPSIDGGTVTKIIEDILNVSTTCRAGYNFTLSTSVNNNNLYLNGDSSNNTAGTYFTPASGNTALNSSPNTWGYYLPSNNEAPTSTSTFLPVPAANATAATIRTTNQTASATDINEYLSIYYGVSSPGSMTPGTYKMIKDGSNNDGTLVYYVTMSETCQTYNVAFNANGGSGTMNTQEINKDEATKLTANSFTAPAKGQSYQNANGTTINADPDKFWVFWGWNTAANGTGAWYKNRESVTNLTSANNTITLYAQWKQATLGDMTTATTGTKTITNDTMQDMNGAICWNSDITTKAALQAANKTGAITLTDNRDGTTRSYDVSKLADGNCWMTTNLALGATSAVTLTSDDTDLADNTTFNLPAGNTTSNTTNTAANIRLTNNSGTDANGVYYSWAAAVASTASRSDIPKTSICPKNWDLPTNDQFSALSTASAYSSTNPTTDLPSQFKVDGGFTNGATFYQTSYGYYWSATSNSVSSAFGARINASTFSRSSNTGTTSGGNKYYRKNIRCVANMDAASYTITFVNTATSATQTKNIVQGQSGTVAPSTNWTRTGYKLKGWDTVTNDGSTGTVVYTNGQSITPTGDMTVYTVWTPSYKITYDINTTDTNAEGAMAQTHTNVGAGDETTLYASNFSRTGYGFAGWSFDPNAQPGGSSTIYGPMETITAPAFTGTPSSTASMALYAVWVQSAGNIQGWTGCSSMSIGDVTALSDQRDTNTYAVAKLADGQCWMIENLRLDTSGSTDETKSQGFGGVFTGLADAEPAWADNSTTANSLYSTDGSTANTISGSNQGYRFPRYNNINTSSRASSPTTGTNVNIYSYGNYYTWSAAMANTESLTSYSASEAANTSLCPTGWRLPTGGNKARIEADDNNEFWNL
ncbi:InlB B-repeat-containing protein, partial [Candidatus Saccharibacteria bacterium]|nr:InlB B-repeat-containing protein [Candidatus Saccharibacteria bacterium]